METKEPRLFPCGSIGPKDYGSKYFEAMLEELIETPSVHTAYIARKSWQGLQPINFVVHL